MEITDEFMQEHLAQSRPYTVAILKQGPRYAEPGSDKIIWEHGRRNFALRADGVLAIVCPVLDDTTVCGFSVFDAPVDDVAKIMDDDPGVQVGVFEYELHPVRSFPNDALPAAD